MDLSWKLVSLFNILNNEITVFKAMKMISNQSLAQKWILHPPCFKPLPFVQHAGEQIRITRNEFTCIWKLKILYILRQSFYKVNFQIDIQRNCLCQIFTWFIILTENSSWKLTGINFENYVALRDQHMTSLWERWKFMQWN